MQCLRSVPFGCAWRKTGATRARGSVRLQALLAECLAKPLAALGSLGPYRAACQHLRNFNNDLWNLWLLLSAEPEQTKPCEVRTHAIIQACKRKMCLTILVLAAKRESWTCRNTWRAAHGASLTHLSLKRASILPEQPGWFCSCLAPCPVPRAPASSSCGFC